MTLFGSYIPLEYVMSGGIGFLAAWLLALTAMPAVHNRAIRLARQRNEDLPLSIKEMRAEKDQIRAGFAAATRQLELNIAGLREKSAAHATELARKMQIIDRLKKELDAVDAALKEAQTREQAVRSELREVRRELSLQLDALSMALRESERREEDARTQLREARRDLAARDAALRAAERDIAGIRSEIAQLAPITLAPSVAVAALPPVRPLAVAEAVEEIELAAQRVDAKRPEAPKRNGLPADYIPLFKPLA